MTSRRVNRLGLVGALLLVGGLGLGPTPVHADGPKKEPGAGAFHPDLGLRGGVYLVLRVEVDKAVMERASRRGEELQRFARDKKVEVTSAEPDLERPVLHVKVPGPARAAFQSVVMSYYQDMQASPTPAGFDLSFKPAEVDRIRSAAVDQTVKTLLARVTKWGVWGPRVVRQGKDRVLVELPGTTDLGQAKDIVGRTARLEFHVVEDGKTGYLEQYFEPLQGSGKIPASVGLGSALEPGPDDAQVQAFYLQSQDRRALDQARAALGPYKPAGTMMAFQKVKLPDGPVYRSLVLARTAPVTGGSLADAAVKLDANRGNRPYVMLRFDARGAKAFGDMTAANVHRRLAIVLDGLVKTAPLIEEPIRGGRASVTLGGLEPYRQLLRKANDLALVLRAGALPAPVQILDEGQVPGSLAGLPIPGGAVTVVLGAAGLLVVVVVGGVLVFRRRSSAGASGGPTGG